jgi:hypothetical protein
METSRLITRLLSEPELVEVRYKQPAQNPSEAADRKRTTVRP